MINNDIISTKLRVYEEAYDYYIEHRQMPNTMPPDDMLVDFMKRVIDENPQIESIDPLWNDILKEEIMKFIVAMLKFFERAENTYQKEKKLIQLFSEGNKEKKRELWAEAYQTIKNQYDPEEVNIEGYIQQFKTNDAESVFGPLIEDWDRACDNRLKNLQKKYHF